MLKDPRFFSIAYLIDETSKVCKRKTSITKRETIELMHLLDQKVYWDAPVCLSVSFFPCKQDLYGSSRQFHYDLRKRCASV